jgi:hypothetical protein
MPTATPTEAPTATPTLAPTATPTPVPTEPPRSDVFVRNYSSYISSTGTLHIVGEVVNPFPQPVQFVEITADLYSSSGVLLTTDFTFSRLSVIPAGEDSPFHVLVFDPPPGVDRYTLSVTDYRKPSFDSPVSGLAVSITNSYTSSSGTLHLVGTVTNSSTTTYKFVEPIAALYDSSGTVIRTDSTFTKPDTLAPGQAGTFDLLVFDPGNWTTYRAWVDGNAD